MRIGPGILVAIFVVAWGPARASGASPAETEACLRAAEQAQALRDEHHLLLEARQRLLVCSRDVCPDVVRRDCTTWLSEIEAATPSLAIHARDAHGDDVLAVRVVVDGVVRASVLDGTSLPVNPGPHRIRLEASSGTSVEREVLVTECQKHRIVEMVFERVTTDSPKALPSTVEEKDDKKDHASSASPIVLGLAGVGVVALGVGTYFEVSGMSDYGTMRDGCAAAHACSVSEVDDAKRNLYVAAPIAFGIGVVSLAVATVLWLSGRSRPGAATAMSF
jgi:hypothetical protein